MGRFSNLFKHVRFDTLNEFEIELLKIQQTTNSKIIALIGIGGRFKGLPLLYATDDEKELKIYAARISEFLIHLKNLAADKSLKEYIIYFGDSIMLFKKLIDNVAFVALTRFESDVEPIRQWIFKKEELLKTLFHEPSSK